MLKILLLLVLVGVVFMLLKAKTRGRTDGGQSRRPDKGAQPMLACAHCGVHLPQNEAVQDADGRVYCSEAHRLAGPR